MIFYWQKFFYMKNIQRSFLVRCRLGKLAFFIQGRIARYARLQKPAKHCSALGSRSFITAQTISQSLPSLLLKLSIILCELVAHKDCNNLVFVYIIVYKLLSVNCSNCVVIKCYIGLKISCLMLYLERSDNPRAKTTTAGHIQKLIEANKSHIYI